MTLHYNVKYYRCAFGFHNVYFKVSRISESNRIFQIDRVTERGYTSCVSTSDIDNIKATQLYHVKQEVPKEDWDRFMVERELSK